MSKSKIAAILYRMRREGSEIASVSGELFSSDELLTRLLGREVTEDEGHNFIEHGMAR